MNKNFIEQSKEIIQIFVCLFVYVKLFISV